MSALGVDCSWIGIVGVSGMLHMAALTWSPALPLCSIRAPDLTLPVGVSRQCQPAAPALSPPWPSMITGGCLASACHVLPQRCVHREFASEREARSSV